MTSDALQKIGFNPYNFGMSFNLYLYPIPANNRDFTIFTFSNYLYIQYNSYLNHITLWKKIKNSNPILIYRQINVPLQAWLKYEINFINGTCDVFINNKLITSRNNILLSDKIDSDVIVGTFDDRHSVIQGKINKLTLFNSPLNFVTSTTCCEEGHLFVFALVNQIVAEQQVDILLRPSSSALHKQTHHAFTGAQNI
jgi:hypothetical protein